MSDLYIGLMSGTSCDGIDASIIKTDGNDLCEIICNHHIPYSTETRKNIQKLFTDFNDVLDVEQEITLLHIRAVKQILELANLPATKIKAIGFHGQAIYHNPGRKITWQIGDAYMLAAETKIDVIADFRSKDVAHGGQGAPLVPIFHKLLLKDHKSPSAIVNIGGVANITYIDGTEIIAFDTGPGNALIDDAMGRYYNKDYDDGGSIASSGEVNHDIINSFMQNDFFQATYPKSLDRNHFNFLLQEIATLEHKDAITTLTYASAASIAFAIQQMPNKIESFYLCGGGVKNQFLTQSIKKELSKYNIKCNISSVLELNNLDADYIESSAFAYLAARYIQNLPSSFPSTTGVSKDIICGTLYTK